MIWTVSAEVNSISGPLISGRQNQFCFGLSGRTVTFDQNGQNAISAEFGILAVSLPDWWFLRTRGVTGTFSQTVKAGIF